MLYLFIYLIEVCLLLLSERRCWGSLLTPLTVLAIPYTLATIIVIITANINPAIPDFYYPSLIIWIFGLFIFWIPSILLSYALKRKTSQFNILVAKRDDSFNILKWIAFICIAVSLTKLSSLSGSMEMYGTDNFSEEYETSGVFNHMSVLLSAIFAYSIYKLDFKLHKIAILIIVLSLIGMYAVGTKSWIIAPFLIGYYARLLTNKTKLSFRTTLLPILIILIVFFLSYYLALILAAGNELDSQVMSFLGMHFLDYFCGSSLSLSLDFQKGFLEPEMTKSLFAPLCNLYNAVFGNSYVSFLNPIQMDIGDLGVTNVRTFFGTIYAYSHSIGIFIIISIVWSFFTNLVYLWSKGSRSIFILLANCTNMAILTLGFFDFYWISLTPYEIVVIFLLFHLLLDKLAIKHKRIR